MFDVCLFVSMSGFWLVFVRFHYGQKMLELITAIKYDM